MSIIYILALKGGRYYIGKSDDVHKRFSDHLNGHGSEWTKLYKPVKIEKVIENASPFEEDKITKEYMCKYGIDKVRGGSYVRPELSSSDIKYLLKEIWSAKNLCTRCGRSTHFVKDCYARNDIYDNEISDDKSEEDSEDYSCYRCGRSGHFANECYAITDLNGYKM